MIYAKIYKMQYIAW